MEYVVVLEDADDATAADDSIEAVCRRVNAILPDDIKIRPLSEVIAC